MNTFYDFINLEFYRIPDAKLLYTFVTNEWEMNGMSFVINCANHIPRRAWAFPVHGVHFTPLPNLFVENHNDSSRVNSHPPSHSYYLRCAINPEHIPHRTSRWHNRCISLTALSCRCLHVPAKSVRVCVSEREGTQEWSSRKKNLAVKGIGVLFYLCSHADCFTIGDIGGKIVYSKSCSCHHLSL